MCPKTERNRASHRRRELEPRAQRPVRSSPSLAVAATSTKGCPLRAITNGSNLGRSDAKQSVACHQDLFFHRVLLRSSDGLGKPGGNERRYALPDSATAQQLGMGRVETPEVLCLTNAQQDQLQVGPFPSPDSAYALKRRDVLSLEACLCGDDQGIDAPRVSRIVARAQVHGVMVVRRNVGMPGEHRARIADDPTGLRHDGNSESVSD